MNNKQKELIEATMNRHITKKKGYCVYCKECTITSQIKFSYRENKADFTTYYLYLCQPCYETQIRGKRLDILKAYIPLLLMKKREKSEFIDIGYKGDKHFYYNLEYNP